MVKNCPIDSVTVDVDLTYPWIGDLTLDLVSPAGSIVRLHNRTGGSADDIVGTYDTTLAVDGPGTLSKFSGEASAGAWTLRVFDRYAGDTGTLNCWGPTIVCR